MKVMLGPIIGFLACYVAIGFMIMIFFFPIQDVEKKLNQKMNKDKSAEKMTSVTLITWLFWPIYVLVVIVKFLFYRLPLAVKDTISFYSKDYEKD